MGTDNLTIFGTNYTGVTGIKATQTGSSELTYVRPSGTLSITSSGTVDVTNYASASVPEAEASVSINSADMEFYTTSGTRMWRVRPRFLVDGAGWVSQDAAGSWKSFNAVPSNTTVTPSTSAQTIGGSSYMMEGAVTVAAMPTGAAGTPTATKGSVSNHAVTVTPSVTNSTGYITGGTKTGTAVTVSASELVSGSETKTANGTYDVTNLAELVVNVSGGSSKNVQVAQSTSRASSSTYTKIASLTCSTAGKYDVYWDCFRSTTGGTSGSQLYLGGSAYGTANTTFSNHAQTNHLSNVSINANQEVAVYARSRGSNYYAYCGGLTIVQSS